MAIIPGKKNFTVDRRADFPIKLTFKDSTGSAINLTGYTVAAQVYDESRSTKYADWAITYTDRANGIIDMNLAYRYCKLQLLLRVFYFMTYC